MFSKILGSSIIDKVLNDETLAPLLENKLKEYPLTGNEKKNVLVIEVENDVIYATVCGRSYNQTLRVFQLSQPKEQKKLIPLLKELITLAKKG
ncbi:MAG: hypothetical protein LBI45_07290 [Bacteroidales bacterium]|jgi:hypothetical protein|nr:hypothetical protein [Bacteroidales bacterium]